MNPTDTKLYYVYLLRSLKFPEQTYVGFTENVEARIKEHNRGGSIHAGRYRPWTLISWVALASQSPWQGGQSVQNRPAALLRRDQGQSSSVLHRRED